MCMSEGLLRHQPGNEYSGSCHNTAERRGLLRHNFSLAFWLRDFIAATLAQSSLVSLSNLSGRRAISEWTSHLARLAQRKTAAQCARIREHGLRCYSSYGLSGNRHLSCHGFEIFIHEEQTIASIADQAQLIEDGFKQSLFFMLFCYIPLQEVEGGVIFQRHRQIGKFIDLVGDVLFMFVSLLEQVR